MVRTRSPVYSSVYGAKRWAGSGEPGSRLWAVGGVDTAAGEGLAVDGCAVGVSSGLEVGEGLGVVAGEATGPAQAASMTVAMAKATTTLPGLELRIG
jgi:hypothetical protein